MERRGPHRSRKVNRRRSLGRVPVAVAVAVATLAALACMSAPAFAAAPEVPETLQPESVTGSGALLRGVLNPGKEGPAGTFEIDTYEFLYNKASAGECKGGSKTGAAMSLGAGMEPVAQPVTGLEAHTKYLVCLAASNGVEAVGAPVSFITGPVEEPTAEAVSEITGTSAELSGELNPGHEAQPGSYAFRFVSSGTVPSASAECEQEGVTQTAGEGDSTGQRGEVLSSAATGLEPDTTYTFCLVALQGGEEAKGQPVTFTTAPAAPAVGAESVVSVGASEATVGAQIEPGAPPGGYRVEYGTSTAYGASTPEVTLGAGAGAVPVLVQLPGLQPGTEYHFRFVAENEHERGKSDGADETLTTAASTGGSTGVLPDNRAYELVSSPTENLTVYSVADGDHGVASLAGDETADQDGRASADGNAIAYAGYPAREGGNGAFSDGQSNEWMATRGPTGWTDTDITPPGTNSAAEYAYFSSDLSVSFLLAYNAGEIAASPAAPAGCKQNLYSRSGDGALHALVSQPLKPGECGYPVSPYASPDGAHLLFGDEVALTTGAEAGLTNEDYNLYDLVDGSLYQVNVLPDGRPEAAPRAWLGGAPSKEVTEQSPNFSNAVSPDGSRIFWTSLEPGRGRTVPKALYVRENDTQPQSPIGPGGECAISGDACTVQIDAGEAKCVAEGKCKSGGGLFWTATADGSKVFFTDPNRLTADATAEPGEPDLYEYEVGSGRLADLTVAASGPADVRGVIGASENGEYLYFAANGVLASNESADGETALKGKEEEATNIYLLHDGATTFIQSGEVDFAHLYDEDIGDWARGINSRTAEVTPDGQEMVFESTRPLTGYDNKGFNSSGNQVEVPEVFIYDAPTGRLSCASCDPAGAPPGKSGGEPYSSLPVPGGGGIRVAAFMLRWLSANGSRVFFDSEQPLVPRDTNGVMDVYEWERPASGSESNNTCSLSSTSYSKVNDGCVFLLSGGQSVDASYFADADAEGNNVFFTSRGQLIPRIVDENVAMYDARVDGGFVEVSTACVGTGCQGVPPAPPIFATPSSVTYDGVGNFEPQPTAPPKPAKCKKGAVRKGGKCVKAKRAKRAKRPSKRAKRRKK